MARKAIRLAPLPAIVVRDEFQAGTLSEVVKPSGISERFYALTIPRQFPNLVVTELIRAAASLAS